MFPNSYTNLKKNIKRLISCEKTAFFLTPPRIYSSLGSDNFNLRIKIMVYLIVLFKKSIYFS